VGPISTSADVDALRLVGGLLQFVRILDQKIRLARPEDGLNLAELSVLGIVGRGSDTPSSIARGLRLDPARITHISDHLVSLGYLRRELDQIDRRRWRIRLTPPGEERVEASLADIDSSMRHLLVGLTPDEVEGLMRALEGIRRVVSGRDED
jgi:DNA-binding MarR family transcriptional regulator